MKIGIITIFRANNYGAELQAFALQRKLELMGFDAELINYPFYKNRAHRKTRLSKPIMDIGFKNRIKEKLFPVLQYWRERKIRDALLKKNEKMEEFHRTNTKLSRRIYCCVEDLIDEVWVYDLFITGSDQVWNPRLGSSLEPYFLSFAPPDKPIVSYAASFGVNYLPLRFHDLYKERLTRYSKIAVRESQGVELVMAVANIKASHVLDPTLLLDRNEWHSVAKRVSLQKPFIFVYELMPCCLLSEIALELSKKIEGSKVVRIAGQAGVTPVSGVHDIHDAGPGEFVNFCSGASAVVTNSFHGTAFAVNFEKPVYPIVPAKMKNASRITSLLDILNMSNFVITEEKALRLQNFGDFKYDQITPLLLKERAFSESYLRNALSLVEKNNEN